MDGDSKNEEIQKDPKKLWTPGEREFYYDLPTNAPITGYVDRCSMFVDLSYRRLRQLHLNHFVKHNFYLIVTHLHLQHNKLKQLPDEIFINLENLMYLDARNNDLESFPVTVKKHEGLETILLQDNLIEDFPIELGSLEGLKTLAIEFNPMRFPSHAVFKQWRNKTDVVDFFKRCWKAQSRNVPAVITNKMRKIYKPKKPKFVHVKDHSEIVCDLKKSNDFRSQKLGDKLIKQIQTKEKLIQKSKNEVVLKNWHDKYRRFKEEERFVVIEPPPYGTDDRYSKITSKIEAMKIDDGKLKSLKYRMNVDEEISGIKKKLGMIGSETRFKDPEGEIAARLREMKAIRKLQKKIEHLKYKT